MNNTPIWKVNKQVLSFKKLSTDITVDVAIIGGGITGITAAYLLSNAGKKVAVLEAHQIGGTTTGYSTGNLYAPVDEELHKIVKNFNKETAALVAESRTTAIYQIERLIEKFNIECDFKRVPWYLFSESELQNNTVEKEMKAAQDSGLRAVEVQNFPLPFKVTKAFRINNQAQLNPLAYITSLASKIQSENCSIYVNSKVENIEEKKDHVLLETEGGSVRASQVIMATHTPKGFEPVQTLLGPYREYALAFKLREPLSEKGIFWGMAGSHHHSLRTYEVDGQPYLLVLGAPHKVGQKEDNNKCLENLEKYVKDRINVGSLAYWWAAQHYKPADGLPYIGERAKGSKVYYATGFSTDGLTYGTLAAMIISDTIMGTKNKWKDVYSTSRFTPLVSAKDFLKENVNVAVQYIKDLPSGPQAKEFAEIKSGEAKTVDVEGSKCAAYRDETGTLHVVSAYCTHMRCVVHWNTAEKTWDCPCHGSRFTINGDVIEGPAIGNLKKIN